MTNDTNFKDHWNTAYTDKAPHQLGWYEASSIISLDLIEELKLEKNSTILSVGAGASSLIGELIAKGYTNITANDISNKALEILKEKLKESSSKVTFITDDLTNPEKLHLTPKVDLWHDRAVLHFFTKKEEQESYFRLIHELVKPGGFVIIGVFSTEGAKKCSGLELQQYDHDLLQEKIGVDFIPIKQIEYSHLTPSFSNRPYIYAVFQRK